MIAGFSVLRTHGSLRRCGMRKMTLITITVGVLFMFSQPVWAQEQSLSFNVGLFSMRGEDGRIFDDVLNENLEVFDFNLQDFNGVSISGEWSIDIGEYLEAGVGLGYYSRSVPSVYAEFVNFDGSEVAQDFRLRISPLTLVMRFFPLTNHADIQPYLGVGVGLFNWRYSESGEFIDFLADAEIFREQYVADGRDLGGLILGGVRSRLTSDLTVGLEVRYQKASGRVGIEQGFFKESLVCDSDNKINNLTKEDILKELQKNTISCKNVSFTFFGLSLATINTIISFILSVITFKLFLSYEKNK